MSSARSSKRAPKPRDVKPESVPVNAAEALLAYIEACEAQSDAERLERCVAAHIRNERLKQYRNLLALGEAGVRGEA